jgi:hypothetical protein
VKLGTNAKCGVEGVGTIRFQLELGGSLEVAYVLYVLELKKNLLLVLAMEDKGYAITFEYGQGLVQAKGSHLDSTRVLGSKEGNLYRLKAQPTCTLVHDNDNMSEL